MLRLPKWHGLAATLLRRFLHNNIAANASAAGAAAASPKATAGNAKPPSAAVPSRPGNTSASNKLGATNNAGGPHDFTKPYIPRHQIVYSSSNAPTSSSWTPTSRRVGVLALKCGMTADWDKWGVRRALTVLRLEDVIITGHATMDTRGYTALQVGSAYPKLKNIDKPLEGYFAAQGVEPRAHLAEFRVTEDAMLPIGTRIDVRHFIPGQFVNVTGISQGKGFQGAMKRHGFRGQSASHGNSVSHRVLGSTGQRQDPGRVIKGKKMPGHLGEDRKTVENLRVYKIDIKRGLLFLEGAVPGTLGSTVRVRDAPKKPFAATAPPPFPTYSLTEADIAYAVAHVSGSYLPYEEERRLRLSGLPLPAGAMIEPPYEIIAPPPETDPFSIPENDEGEEK